MGEQRGFLNVKWIGLLSLLAVGTTSCTYCRVALLDYALQAHSSKGKAQNLTTELAVGPAADPERHGRGWALGPAGGVTLSFKDPEAVQPAPMPDLLYGGMKFHYFLYRTVWNGGGKGETPELLALGASLMMGTASAWYDESHGVGRPSLRGAITEGELFARLTLLGFIAFRLSVGAERAPAYNGVFARISFTLFAPAVLGTP